MAQRVAESPKLGIDIRHKSGGHESIVQPIDKRSKFITEDLARTRDAAALRENRLSIKIVLIEAEIFFQMLGNQAEPFLLLGREGMKRFELFNSF
jgi:hypothetical protein